MLLPQFSIRTLLLVCVGVAMVALLAGQAVGGRAWAVGVTAAVLSVPLALGMQAIVFAACTAMGRLLGAEETVARTSRGGVERASRPANQDEPPGAGTSTAATLPK